MPTNKSLSSGSADAEIWTEGKTDVQILKKALQVLGVDFAIEFHKATKDMGSDKLLKSLQTFAERKNPIPLIFIFDRDDKNIMAQVETANSPYKDWGNNVYSFPLPIPTHRSGYENVCIEMYFSDDEIHRRDTYGRQLFLTSDFNESSGNHKLDPSVHCNRISYLKGSSEIYEAKIVDADVYDANNVNIALSKSDFADYVGSGLPPYDNLDFVEFREVINRIEQIINITQPQHNIHLLEVDRFFASIAEFELANQFKAIFRRLADTIALALQIFIIITIRVYENEIINEPEAKRKRVTPIKKIITEAFRKPSLNTLRELAEKCFYLIDSGAPSALTVMKECLEATIQLNELGTLWDNLEELFPDVGERSRIVAKHKILRNFLTKVIPEIARYASKPEEVIDHGINQVIENPAIKIEIWKRALVNTTNLLQPIFSSTVVLKTVKSRDPVSDQYTLEVRTYQNNRILYSAETVERLNEDYERRSSELVLAENLRVHIYPLLLVRDNALFMYKRTIPSGYEYYSILRDRIHIEPTKKKFSQMLFQVGSKQELFWTDVLPQENPANSVRANIPEEGPHEFIGRRKQIKQIKDEIVNIVNENGIIYGPGGIGKTSLIIQLTKELFNEQNKDNILYNNIIWVSAKNDFYDYIFDSVEKREPQVKSLDSIIFAILKFFEFENLEEYSFEDRKELVTELLKDHKVLLIIDNFESISKGEADKIVEFFGTQIKKTLQRKPEYFKVILTSRELIPSGFRQIELTGLDIRDSKRLIDSLYKRYKSTNRELTEEQKEQVHAQTKGIPILIKHCIAKIFEYNQPFDTVVKGFMGYSANIVQFSFREILLQIERETDKVGLKILILLEIVDIALMIRQMADVLEIDEATIEAKLPLLANFECVRRVNQDNQEKFLLNDEIRLLTKSLTQQYHVLFQDIRVKYFRNFTFDKTMDYTSEEEEIIGIFEGYVTHREYTDAEDFLNKELRKRPGSVLLNYYYARYLKDRRNDIDQSIRILENLRIISHNHPSVLKLLFTCYASASIPRFENAENLINQIEADLGTYLEQELDLQIEIARFYVRWSLAIKDTKGIDPYEENKRRARYKELAKKSLAVLQHLEIKLSRNKSGQENQNVEIHEVCFRMSQCYYVLWDYESALKTINRAIQNASQNQDISSSNEYQKFKMNISETREFYSRHPWAEQRQTK